MDWLNLRELIGCVLVEAALGTQYGSLFRLEYYVNPSLRKKLLLTKAQTDPDGFANLDEGKFVTKYAAWTGLVQTLVAIACLYIAGDFVFNVF